VGVVLGLSVIEECGGCASGEERWQKKKEEGGGRTGEGKVKTYVSISPQ